MASPRNEALPYVAADAAGLPENPVNKVAIRAKDVIPRSARGDRRSDIDFILFEAGGDAEYKNTLLLLE
jgi:hypothetical protein